MCRIIVIAPSNHTICTRIKTDIEGRKKNAPSQSRTGEELILKQVQWIGIKDYSRVRENYNYLS